MKDYSKALRLRYHGMWSMQGMAYEDIVWHSTDVEKPTQAQLDAALAEIENPPPPPTVVTKRSLLLCMTPNQRQLLASNLSSLPPGPAKDTAMIYYRESKEISSEHAMLPTFLTFAGITTPEEKATLFAAAKAQDLVEAQYL